MQRPVIEQAKDTALRGMIAQLLPELRASARMLTRSRAEADDLVQDAVLRMLRNLDSFEPAPELAHDLRAAIRPWALTVLRNAFREGWRRAKREQAHREAPTPDIPPPPSDQETAHELRDIARSLARLSPTLREALVLVAARGLSHEEAAAICNVPVGTMKARVSRARKALSDDLAPVMG
jgi:RNA polymerase sigma-70 factor (ECF subfamily)